jgi:hypothetical protein
VQQDIARGRGMVDAHFQGAGGKGGTHNAILSSEEYLSTAQKTFNNMEEGYYISPAFLDKARPRPTGTCAALSDCNCNEGMRGRARQRATARRVVATRPPALRSALCGVCTTPSRPCTPV